MMTTFLVFCDNPGISGDKKMNVGWEIVKWLRYDYKRKDN